MELRGLYVTIALRDLFTPGLKRANALMDQSRKRMEALAKSTQKWMYQSAAFDNVLSTSSAFFAQLDRIEKQVIIQSKYHHAITQKLAYAYSTLKDRISAYVSVITSKFATVNEVLNRHRLALIGISAALTGFMGLSLRGAMNEEKYRRNIESLAEVIDYEKEGWENVNKALQDYITSAEKLSYISKETRAHLVSEMVTLGVAKDTILKYGPILEKLGISLGKTTDEVITAVRSSLSGLHMPFKRLGIILREEDIKKKMEEIRDAHKGWSEEAIRAEAIMELAYPQMIRRIGDFDKAIDSAYGDLVKFREKLSDLTGDIGAIYIPYFRKAVEILSRFIKFLNASPILKTAFAFSTLGLTVSLIGGITIPKAYNALKSFFTISKAITGFIYSRMIPATVAEAYATGGLTMALRTMALTARTASDSLFGLSVPLLPLIAVITAVVGAILLLQDILTKGWEKSYLGRFVSWLLDKLPPLKSAAESVGNAINWLRQGFDWLAKSIGGAINWIQQAIDKLGPLKYLLLGPVGGIVYLITHIDKLKQSITSVPDAIGQFLDRLGPLRYLLLGPVGSIVILIRNIDRLKSATSSALITIKSLWDRTIGWIITKIDEFITKIEQAWEFITKSPIGKAIEIAFSFTPAGVILNAIKIVQPKIKPVIEKPEMDKRFYEEGSVVLKVKTPKIKPEIEKPELSWLEQLYFRVKPLFEMTGIPELTGIIRYIPDVVKPKVRNFIAGVTYIPKLVKPEITHELTRITPTPSQLASSTVIHQPTTTYQVKHEHKTIQVPKIEIKIEGIKDPDKVAEVVERRLKQQFNAIGVY